MFPYIHTSYIEPPHIWKHSYADTNSETDYHNLDVESDEADKFLEKSCTYQWFYLGH